MKKKLIIFLTIFVIGACLLHKVHSDKNKIPYEAKMLLETGIQELNNGQTTKAIDTFGDLTTLYPNFEKGYYSLGVGYAKNNQPTFAIKAWEEALKLNPKNADTLYNMALAYNSTNQDKLALKFIDEYLKTEPKDKTALEFKNSIKNQKSIDFGQGVIGKITLSNTKRSNVASSVFDKKTKSIFCNLEVFSPQKETPLLLKWVFITRDNSRVPVNTFSYKIKEAETIVVELSKPQGDWPIGNYETEIYLNNKKAFSIPFKIIKQVKVGVNNEK